MCCNWNLPIIMGVWCCCGIKELAVVPLSCIYTCWPNSTGLLLESLVLVSSSESESLST